MQVKATTSKAIQILSHLHKRQDSVQSASMIAESVGITYPLFAKLAVRLRRAGLLTSVPGRSGGYMLGKPADEISFYDVFSAVEGPPALTPIRDEGNCKVQTFLRAMQDKVIAEMAGICIADLV